MNLQQEEGILQRKVSPFLQHKQQQLLGQLFAEPLLCKSRLQQGIFLDFLHSLEFSGDYGYWAELKGKKGTPSCCAEGELKKMGGFALKKGKPLGKEREDVMGGACASVAELSAAAGR